LARFEHWREILRAIWCANAYSNTNSDCNTHANGDTHWNAWGDTNAKI